jgi:predicted acyl esterase
MKTRFLFLFLFCTIGLASLSSWASLETVNVPMKDGIKLAADVHLPATSGSFPVIFLRTTYNKAMAINVYPDGRSYNICEGALRARLRDGFDQQHRLEPGKIYPFEISLWSTSIVFNKAHKLRVHVTSSSDRGYDPNPNTGEPFRSSDKSVVAKNTIYLEASHPSQIVLPVMPEPQK